MVKEGFGLNPGRSARGQWRKLSAPIERLIVLGLLDPTQSVFDYGCGQGLDMRYLRQRGFEVSGWDPNWLADGQIRPADVVVMNFVVDCIADPAERVEALQRAWSLSGDYMMVTVRRDRSLRRLTRYSDGWLTQWRTFQRLFTQGEFYQFLKGSLPNTEPMEFERGGCALIAKTDDWHRRIESYSHWIRNTRERVAPKGCRRQPQQAQGRSASMPADKVTIIHGNWQLQGSMSQKKKPHLAAGLVLRFSQTLRRLDHQR